MSELAAQAERAEQSVQGSAPLLRIEDLAVSFASGNGPRAAAVDGAGMTIHPGQTVALVGESGCGKSVTAMSVLRLVACPPGRYDRGRILLERGGRMVDLLREPERAMRRVRGADVAMIFQEPMTSLNPVYTIGEQVMEAILLHQSVDRRGAREIAIKAMSDVGIPDPAARLGAYPHEFSGGMRQRVMIAMALACEPRLLLADEPTTALDVTIQAQILELLDSLRRDRGMSIMLITHDLGVVAEHADVVCVMYAGRVVEYGRVFDVFDNPLHPYTRGLFASIPKMHERRRRLVTIKDVIEDESQWERLGGKAAGWRPWWAWHEKPEGVVSTPTDSALVEVEPEHWVGVWRTPEADAEDAGVPELAFRRGRREVG